MRETITDLWNGDIAPVEHCGVHDSKANHLMHLMAKNREALREELSETQKEKYQVFLDVSQDYLLRMMELSFCDGFCLGIRLAMESLV